MTSARKITRLLVANRGEIARRIIRTCDQLGIESATALNDRRQAEGKAVGGGCRHAARSIEQCYATNKKADKAAVFAGWREMEDYMRENKIEAVPAPPEVKPAVVAEGAEKDEAAEPGHGAAKSAGAKKGS